MKKISILFLLAGILALASCEPEADPVLSVGVSSLTVEETGGTFEVSVTSNVDIGVTVPSDCNWISVLRTKAGPSPEASVHTWNIVVSPNETTDSRSADITFGNETYGLSRTVKVTQAQKNAIVVAQSRYELPAEGGTIDVAVSHNLNFTVELSDSWIRQAGTKAMITETLRFAVEENLETESRTGTITFRAGDLVQQVTVFQQPSPVNSEELVPGFFGFFGLDWTYRYGIDQTVLRVDGDGLAFALIDPSANKVMAVTLSELPQAAGDVVDVIVTQNADKTRAALFEANGLKVARISGRCIKISDNAGGSAVLIVK